MSWLFDQMDRIRVVAASSPLGLVTDIDGTLSELAPSPQEALIAPEILRLLDTLVQRIAVVAVVSGRPVAEAMAILQVPGVLVFGNHGLEYWDQGESHLVEAAQRYVDLLEGVAREAEASLSLPGLLVERKGATVAFHYRNCSDPESARSQILQALAKHPEARDLQLLEGKRVIELLPPKIAGKGEIVRMVIARYQLQGVFYLGDDTTDLDAFVAVQEARRNARCRGLAIGVMGRETPSSVRQGADLLLRGVPEVGRFLEWLAEAVRPAPPDR